MMRSPKPTQRAKLKVYSEAECKAFLPATFDKRQLTTESSLRTFLYFQTDSPDERRKLLPNLAAHHKSMRRRKDTRTLLETWQREARADLIRRLRDVLNGKDPRVVFKLGVRKKQGERVGPIRDQLIALNVLMLHHIEGLPEAEAKRLVCDHFSSGEKNMDMRTVQAAVKKWRDHPMFTKPGLEYIAHCLKAVERTKTESEKIKSK